MAIQRYKLTIAYDGTHFHGWQEQNPPDGPSLRTVQGVLRQAVGRTVGQPVDLIGASRTDTGVHALGQTAAFTAETRIPLERLASAINSRLTDEVDVRQVRIVDAGFDPIRDAKSKQYRYRIHNAGHRPVLTRSQVYHCWYDLDETAMTDAAARLIGEHDFAAFANAGHGRETTVRTVHDCRIERPSDLPELHIVISGNGFLYNMVRIIAGTLVEVGRGHWPADCIDVLFDARDRAEAGPTLPPQGLCLEWIRY